MKIKHKYIRLLIMRISSHKEIPFFLVIAGTLAIVYALTADYIGLGDQGGLGIKQIALAVAGGMVLFSGLVMINLLSERNKNDWIRLFIPDKKSYGYILILGLQLGALVYFISQIKIEGLVLHDVAILVFFGCIIYYWLKVALGDNAILSGGDADQTAEPKKSSIYKVTSLGLIILPLILFLTVKSEIYTQLGVNVQKVLYNIRVPQLSKRDISTIQKGYYENLTRIDWFTSELAGKGLRPDYWGEPIQRTSAGRRTGDFLKLELVPSSETLFFGAPFHTNRWGMRDRDYTKEKNPTTFRIALLGPSYVMGLGVADEETFEWVLEDKLNSTKIQASFDKFEILNFAVSDYTAIHQPLILEEKVFPFDPDAIFYISNNDKGYATWHLAEMISTRIPIPYEELRKIVEKAGVENGTEIHEATRQLKLYDDEILYFAYNQIVKQCQEQNILPVWIFIPLVGEDYPSEDIEKQFNIAKEAGFIILDLSNVFSGYDPESLWLAEYDHHPNPSGHSMIADHLYDWMNDNWELFKNFNR